MKVTAREWCVIIQDTVRLIDMAFFPLLKEISEEVNTINIHAQELYETVIKSDT